MLRQAVTLGKNNFGKPLQLDSLVLVFWLKTAAGLSFDKLLGFLKNKCRPWTFIFTYGARSVRSYRLILWISFKPPSLSHSMNNFNLETSHLNGLERATKEFGCQRVGRILSSCLRSSRKDGLGGWLCSFYYLMTQLSEMGCFRPCGRGTVPAFFSFWRSYLGCAAS